MLIKTFKTRTTDRDKKGKYGRYLADVLIEQDENGNTFPDEARPVWLAQYLIDQGQAKVY